jgi:hypothetical protein
VLYRLRSIVAAEASSNSFGKKNNIDRNEEKQRITGNIDRKNLVIK